MSKFIMYKDNLFFLSPAEAVGKKDMNFKIFNLNGDLIGTTMFGIDKWENLFNSEDEKDEFMYLLDVEAQKEEAIMKFACEFGCPIEQADQLELSAVEIMDVMESKWSIPPEIMDELLPTIECMN